MNGEISTLSQSLVSICIDSIDEGTKEKFSNMLIGFDSRIEELRWRTVRLRRWDRCDPK